MLIGQLFDKTHAYFIYDPIHIQSKKKVLQFEVKFNVIQETQISCDSQEP